MTDSKEQQPYPSDINAYFKQLVDTAWEKANKRQKLKARKENEKNRGFQKVLEEMRKI